MAIRLIKIEHIEHYLGGKSHSRKWYKNQRNRKIRRVKKTMIPNTKEYKDYEY